MSSMSTSLGPKLNANYARLRSAWLQEQFAPEILEYQTEAVQYHLGQLEIVVSFVLVLSCCFHYSHLARFL
jgi:hypothetical protein